MMDQQQQQQQQQQPAQQKQEEYQQSLREAAERANRFMEARGYHVSQKNGQRISTFTQEHDLLEQMPAGQHQQHNSSNADTHQQTWQDEVFVGRIPRDLFEDELLPFMERAGPVRVIRLMMDFSGTTRGYSFVRYVRSEDATFACQQLSGAKIRHDSEAGVGIKLSLDNKGLIFSGLPADYTAAKLKGELCKILDGVEQVKLLKPDAGSMKRRPANRLLTFEVQFKSHFCATQARRNLIPMLNKQGSRQYSVDWARPDPPAMNKARSPTASCNLASQRSTPLGTHSINNNNNILNLNSQSILLSNHGQHQSDIWDSILNQQSSLFGDATRNILMDFNQPINHYDPSRSVTLSNINLSPANLDKVKQLFELGCLRITRIIPGQLPGVFTIEYETREEAEFLYEAVILLPKIFKDLARNDDLISVSWPYHAYNNKPSFSTRSIFS